MSATRWFYVQDDKRMGPVDMEQIVRLVLSAALPPSTLVWHQGLAEWTEAERVPEIEALLPPPVPPGKPERPAAPEPPPVPPPARVAAKATPAAPAPPSGPPPAAPAAAPAASAGGARIQEMRRRLEKEPHARVFSQLADELRKEGDLAEAVRVCRDGVQRYATYPSLRVTLGRLLLESGDLAAARTELETALQAAPDNILAERSLGECLEALGDLPGARARYEAALALAPADAQLAARLRAIEEREAEEEPDAVIAPALEDPLAALDLGPLPAPPAPDTGLDIELDVPAPLAEEPAPIPLVAVEEPFVIERAGDVSVAWKPFAAGAPAARPSATPTPSKRAAGAPAAAAATTATPAVAPRAAPKPPVAAATVVPPRVSAVAWPSGRLADHEFADLVSEVYARRWSGLLTLNHMGVEKSIRVKDGGLVFASSSSRDDRLGELLLRTGRITLHQYVAAGRALGKGKRLGAILVEQGALDARDLVRAVVEQTQEIIYSAFQWTEGLYHLTEAGEAAESIMLKLSTPNVILEGIRRVEAWSRIEKGVGGLDARYVRTEAYEQALDQMGLSLEKLSLLTALETEQDLGTICRQSTLSHFEVCRTMWAYRVIGVVRRVS
ncbi:MAG TPA: DUF4388 domain-containing protein [Vicinamibacteria bacterium]|nr:DUF4388 domain-containing protein [Vicinamibacteria bacterium]